MGNDGSLDGVIAQLERIRGRLDTIAEHQAEMSKQIALATLAMETHIRDSLTPQETTEVREAMRVVRERADDARVIGRQVEAAAQTQRRQWFWTLGIVAVSAFLAPIVVHIVLGFG